MQRPGPMTRFMERSNSMRREKRDLDGPDAEESPPEPKRQKVPALASVIVEALKVDSLQKLCSSLEPILRRVVSEEVERALAKLGPARIGARSSPKRIEGPDGRNLQLQFRTRLSLPLFTGGKVEGEQGSAIHVVLLDATTGQVLTSGQESYAKLDVVVLEGDFNHDEEDGWTQEDFESQVVKEREGKRPLLTGDVQVTLKEGVGTLGDLTFTDNSSWIRSRKFRLGLKVASGYCEGIRIREAKTEAFTVKDHRGELYKKHYPPALGDEVWRLEKIGKDGSFHKRLNKAGIQTVEDFLRLVVRDSQKLRNILGSGMSNKMWESAVDHAKTCVLGGKLYVYYNDDSRNVGVVFNNIYELCGLIAADQYCPAESLSDSQKVCFDTLLSLNDSAFEVFNSLSSPASRACGLCGHLGEKAYDNWIHVVEYDGKALLNFKESKKMITARSNIHASSSISEYQSFDQQGFIHRMPVTITAEQAPVDPGTATTGDTTASSYSSDISTAHLSTMGQSLVANATMPFENTAYSVSNQLMNSSHQPQVQSDPVVGLALGPPQTPDTTFLHMTPLQTPSMESSVGSLDDWARHRDHDFFSEEDIRMRSSEMLENEDMQQLLRLFSMGGGGTMNMADDSFGYSSYIPSPLPNYGYSEDRGRSSGKAVVGWLKLKAALRWGIFIRKIAAQKRAQLVELDES